MTVFTRNKHKFFKNVMAYSGKKYILKVAENNKG